MIFKLGTDSVIETIDWGFTKRTGENILRLNQMKLKINEDLTSTSLTSPISVTPVEKSNYVV